MCFWKWTCFQKSAIDTRDQWGSSGMLGSILTYFCLLPWQTLLIITSCLLPVDILSVFSQESTTEQEATKVASLKLQKSTWVFKNDEWLWNIRYYILICSITALIVQVKSPADVCACLQIFLCIYILGWSQNLHIFACLSVWLLARVILYIPGCLGVPWCMPEGSVVHSWVWICGFGCWHVAQLSTYACEYPKSSRSP